MNHKRKRPRSKSYGNPVVDRESTPAHHNISFHSRPRRRRDKARCVLLMQGKEHPDAMTWELGNHKPHVYYW
jgi:hypothetical protein